MINEHLEKSIEILERDSEFIKGVKDIADDSFSRKSEEERLDNIVKAQKWILHVLDYCVTAGMIDMDADLARICQDNLKLALKLRKSLNDTALALKLNYQYLCKEGTIYSDGLPLFKLYYKIALLTKLQGTTLPQNTPNYIIDFSSMEFICSESDQLLLKRKLEQVESTGFTLPSIKSFIDKCFSWSETINTYLDRMSMNRSVMDIDNTILQKIYYHCGDKVFNQKATPQSFADAIRNISKPQFQIINKDYFYAILFAIYNSLGPLSSRDSWLKQVLQSFNLENSSYLNAKRRIEQETTPKLLEHYKQIKEIIEDCNQV